MTGTLNNVTPARDFGYRAPQYFKTTVTYATPNIGTVDKVLLGVLPAGARIRSCACLLDVAFNAATTNVLTVGTSAGSDANIMSASDITEGTPANYTVTTGALLTFAVDTP